MEHVDAVIVILWELRLVEFCYAAANLGLSFRSYVKVSIWQFLGFGVEKKKKKAAEKIGVQSLNLCGNICKVHFYPPNWPVGRKRSVYLLCSRVCGCL